MKDSTNQSAGFPSEPITPDTTVAPLEPLQGAPPAVGEESTDIPQRGVDEIDSTTIEVKASGIVITIPPNAPKPAIVVDDTGRSVIHIVRAKKRRTAADRQASLAEAAMHIRISKAAFAKVRETVGSLPAERGGIFVGPDPFCIEDFIFDEGKQANRNTIYYPDTAYLNEILERDHEPHGRRFVGLAHSHPNGYWRPSGDAGWGDVKAAKNNLMAKDNTDLPALFIPIIESAATTGTFNLHPFVMLRRDFRVRAARYEVID